MELFGLARVCARCRRLITGDGCANCAGSDVMFLTSDIYASARGIEAPPLYDAADRGLSIALLVEFFAMALAASTGWQLWTMLVGFTMMATAGMIAWGLPALRQRHRLRLVMRARARALPPSRWRPEQPASVTEVTGVAKKLKREVVAPLSHVSCLAAVVDIVVRDKLAAREVVAEDFLVVPGDGPPVIVTGTIWLEPCESDVTMHTGEAELQVGDQSVLPARFRPGGVAHESRIDEGCQITVRGRATMEHHPDLVTSYRDPEIQILRGEPGHPVSIEREPLTMHMVYR